MQWCKDEFLYLLWILFRIVIIKKPTKNGKTNIARLIFGEMQGYYHSEHYSARQMNEELRKLAIKTRERGKKWHLPPRWTTFSISRSFDVNKSTVWVYMKMTYNPAKLSPTAIVCAPAFCKLQQNHGRNWKIDNMYHTHTRGLHNVAGQMAPMAGGWVAYR